MVIKKPPRLSAQDYLKTLKLDWGDTYTDQFGQIQKYFPVHKAQADILQAPARFVAACAGSGGGKSAVGALWLSQRIAEDPQAHYLIVAPSYKIFWSATFQRWTETVEGTALQGDYNDTRKEYRLPTGGVVYCRSADDPDSFEGIQAKAAWVDEGGNISVRAWRAARRRVGKHGGRVLITTTPYAHNWFFTEFYKRWQEGNKEYYLRQWASNLNPTYSKEEFEQARRELPPHIFAMFHLGKFERPSGLVYPGIFNCVVDKPASLPKGRLVGGIDFGYQDPFAAIAGILDDDNTLWLVYERYQRECDVETHAKNLPPNVRWVCDRSRPESIRTMRRYNISCRKAGKQFTSIASGVEVVSRWINSGRLKIIKGACPSLLAEAELYRYPADESGNPFGDTPAAGQDHALDALRMMLCALDRRHGRHIDDEAIDNTND